MLAFVFPGQGSQTVGMGKALVEAFPIAKRTFEEADEALELPLMRTCFEGPEEALRRTEITQPALLTTSIACLRVLAEQRPDLKPGALAGHSLGEWSALVAGGAIGFQDAVRAVRARGRFMQDAVPEGLGTMAAVLGLEPEQVAATLAGLDTAGEIVSAANFNSPEQTVISGHAGAVKTACAALSAKGAKRIVELQVSAPFHSPLMEPAARNLAETLRGIEIRSPSAPVVTNVEAAPTSDPIKIRALLVAQVTAPVRWVECVQALVKLGATDAIELGPGRVLGALGRRIDRNLKFHGIEDPASLEKTSAALPSAP